MNKVFFYIVLSFFASCSPVKYFIVRHAEKATQGTNMSSDVPLSDKGKQRAVALKELLKRENIGYVYSTNTNRTRTTAAPVAEYFSLPVQIYDPMPKDSFIIQLKSLKKNTLIVGHSNTVDDIVNKLCGEVKVTKDLPDSVYNNLYIITRKGSKMIFANKKYGVTVN